MSTGTDGELLLKLQLSLEPETHLPGRHREHIKDLSVSLQTFLMGDSIHFLLKDSRAPAPRWQGSLLGGW